MADDNVPAQPGADTGGDNAPTQPGADTGGDNAPTQPGADTGGDNAPTQPGADTGGDNAPTQPGADSDGEARIVARARVVLVGPPGSGKSTIGRKLARELGVELFDTDAGIEAETGRSIPEIFAEDGEPEFRRIEEQVVRRAVLEHEGVVSLGGGSVLSARTREVLRGATVVYLEISVGEGLRRTGSSNARPLLNGADPAAKYRELMKQRRPLYREVATVRVRTDGRSPGRVVRMILARLGLESVRTDIVRTADTTKSTPPSPSTPGSGSNRSKARRRSRARAAAARRGEILPAPTAQADNDGTTSAAARPAPGRSASGETPPGEGRRSRRNRLRRRGSRSRAGSATDSTRTGEPTAAAASPADEARAETSAGPTENARTTRPNRRGRKSQPSTRSGTAQGSPADSADDSPTAGGRRSGAAESTGNRSRRGSRGRRGSAKQAAGGHRSSATDPGAETPAGPTDQRVAQQPADRGPGEPAPGSWRARPRRRATRRMTNDPRESEQRT
ncbi:AAA family ATPase [Nocardia coubleae]|uniref:Shikimate kinase n=1 Tax=Nocardia coubleae TaxID=356147 RepID=A0A846WBN7_9NOCA|nr:AAA family ATPase [Nocardia coubleae]